MRTQGEYSPTKTDIEYYFDINLKFLSMIGLDCDLDDKGTRKLRFINKLLVYMTNLQGVICAILEVYTIANALSSDSSLATKVISQLVSNVQCISKGFRLAQVIHKLQEVLKNITIIWKRYRPIQENKIINFNELQNTMFFCKCYFFVVISVIACYDIPPLMNLLLQYLNRERINHTYDYSQRILLVKYPFPVDNIGIYILAYFQEGYLLFVSCIFWLSCDTLFAQITTHICFQFKILKSEIEEYINRENNLNRLKKNLIVFIRRHLQLLNICDLIEEIFSPVILSTMLLSALNICVNIFEVRETLSKGYYGETGIYLFIFVATFFQILFFCVFAENLTEETGSLANSVYNCKWTKKNYKLRFYLQLIMMRCQRPFYCTAYGFFAIGHKQLSSIISTSFSYYMMLQTVH